MDKLKEITLEETQTIITDVNKASWAFREIIEIEKQMQDIEDLAKSELERINNWKKEELKSLQDSKQFFDFNLEQYFREQRELDPKFKLSTPYGKVTARKQQPKWNYEDDKTIEWLKENDISLIRIKEEVNKAELKKKYQVVGNQVVDLNGEIVEGIEIEYRDETITVKATI